MYIYVPLFLRDSRLREVLRRSGCWLQRRRFLCSAGNQNKTQKLLCVLIWKNSHWVTTNYSWKQQGGVCVCVWFKHGVSQVQRRKRPSSAGRDHIHKQARGTKLFPNQALSWEPVKPSSLAERNKTSKAKLTVSIELQSEDSGEYAIRRKMPCWRKTLFLPLHRPFFSLPSFGAKPK